MSLTIPFEIESYRKDHAEFDNWFFKTLEEMNIKFFLTNDGPVIKGHHFRMIEFFAKLNKIENKTLEQILGAK